MSLISPIYSIWCAYHFNKGLCGRVVKAVDSSSTIVKMHAFEPRRSHYFLFLNKFHSIQFKLLIFLPNRYFLLYNCIITINEVFEDIT